VNGRRGIERNLPCLGAPELVKVQGRVAAAHRVEYQLEVQYPLAIPTMKGDSSP
jgi:hypothetical protein